MNLSIFKYLFFVLTCFITISMYGQENVTKEKNNINTPIVSDPYNTITYPSDIPIHHPNDQLDQQIKHTLINDTKNEKVLMPIFNTSSMLLINPKRQLSLGEIAKKLKEDA